MSKFNEFLAEQLQDPAVKREYDALEAEYREKQMIYQANISTEENANIEGGRINELS